MYKNNKETYCFFVKYLVLNVKDGKVSTVRVDMGEPSMAVEDVPVSLEGPQAIDAPIQVDGKEWRITCVSMGNPHAVTFVPTLDNFPMEYIGPMFEKHEIFPKRTNTEFIEIISRNEMKMRVWERGSGETFACGTGACASVMAGILNGHTEDAAVVHLLGGDLFIEYDRATNHIFMTGPATTVFEGEIE